LNKFSSTFDRSAADRTAAKARVQDRKEFNELSQKLENIIEACDITRIGSIARQQALDELEVSFLVWKEGNCSPYFKQATKDYPEEQFCTIIHEGILVLRISDPE